MNGHKTVTANFSFKSTASASSYYNKGYEYYEAEYWAAAVSEFTRAIGVNPNYTNNNACGANMTDKTCQKGKGCQWIKNDLAHSVFNWYNGVFGKCFSNPS